MDGDVCGPFTPDRALFLHPNEVSRFTLARWISEYPDTVIYETRPVGEAPVKLHDPHALPSTLTKAFTQQERIADARFGEHKEEKARARRPAGDVCVPFNPDDTTRED